MFKALLFGILVGTLVSGCNFIPSPFRIFGTPVTRAEKATKRSDEARESVIQAARESAHKTQVALAKVEPSRAAEVAQDFASETVALLDQALGPVMLGDLNRWQDQVERLCSEDLAVRAKAELERSKERYHNETLAKKLAAAEDRADRAESKLLDYAKVKERQADILLKVAWAAGIIAFLWIASQVLTIAAKFYPPLAGASALLNKVAAPAVQYGYEKAKDAFEDARDGLHRVGRAMTEIRAELPGDTAEKVESILDGHVDESHKNVIKAGTIQI
jgi:hypothetical protein